MFDFEVFIGPAVVLLGMFIGLLGFAIWGTKAIRESVPLPELSPLLDDVEAAAPLAELELPDIESPFGSSADLAEDSLANDSQMRVNLEKTAEFEQPLTTVNTVASFSQSFWEGQEVATPSAAEQPDYTDAIDRIQAGLNVAGAEEFNKNAGDADAMTAADVLEALRHGVVAGGGADSVPEDLTEDSREDSDEETTRLISPEENAAILADELQTEPEPALDAANATDAEIDKEATIVLSGLEGAAAEETLTEKKDTAALSNNNTVSADNDLAGNMEETVVMKKIAEEPTPNLQRIPPGVASSFGFINNQANGLASAVGMSPKPLPDLSSLTKEEAGDIPLPETPIPFGPKMAWLAVPGFKPSEVIAALRLDDVQTANWSKGLQEAYADNNLVYVSPSLGGWVLVIGKTLWERADMNRSAENIPWLKEICRKFGNACFFSTMRGLNNHGWVGIRDGQIFRAYGYSGELQDLIWLIGEPTEEEIAINPAFITEMREKYQPGFRPIIPDEKLVLAVAAAWSVDPGFRRRQYPADFGFLGYLN